MKRYILIYFFFPLLSFAQVGNQSKNIKKSDKSNYNFSIEEHKQYILDSILMADSLLIEQEAIMAMRISDSAWTPDKEQELKAIVYAAEGMEKFPDSVKMKFYNCILWKSKVRIPDAIFNRQSDRQIMIDISAECAEDCDMDFSKYKEKLTLVMTKDGVSIGDRNEFITLCTKGADEEIMDFNGLKIETYKYCSCICDNLIPIIHSNDLQKALNEGKLVELITNDENLQILMDCAEGNVKMDESFKFGDGGDVELQIKIGIKNCVNEVMNNKENNFEWTKAQAEQYCKCAIEKFFSNGYTLSELNKIEDENSVSYNEVAIPCMNELLNSNSNYQSSNLYILKDILGEKSRTEIPLINYFGKSYKIKISIAGISKYYLFDTGASDLIINKELADELLSRGKLSKDNILYETEYTLANNNTVKGKKVKIDNITIGDYTLNNVVIGIIDDGSLLCGKSFLDKFSKWEIDMTKNILILYK
jgi:clan AA aspartic protease (TIGR02281 family)